MAKPWEVTPDEARRAAERTCDRMDEADRQAAGILATQLAHSRSVSDLYHVWLGLAWWKRILIRLGLMRIKYSTQPVARDTSHTDHLPLAVVRTLANLSARWKEFQPALDPGEQRQLAARLEGVLKSFRLGHIELLAAARDIVDVLVDVPALKREYSNTLIGGQPEMAVRDADDPLRTPTPAELERALETLLSSIRSS